MSRAPFRPGDEVDFVVIGSGAAGGVVAKELATAGFSVVVLEQGPYLRERDFTHDEFAVTYRNALTNDYRTQPNTVRKSAGEKCLARSLTPRTARRASARATP